MKKLFSIFFLVIYFNSYSQRVDIGLGLGLANYWGDLAPSIAFSESKPTISVFARLNLSNVWALTGQITTLQVSGTDKNFDFNKSRNLSFTDNITEYAGLVEYNFANYGYGVLDSKITGYIFGGFAGFKYTPQTVYAGQTVNLRDLKTEDVIYSTYSFAIPFGIGAKWIFARYLSLEANFNIRKTYTDYIDDVSGKYADLSKSSIRTQQIADRSYEIIGSKPSVAGTMRGSDNYNDWYMTFTTSLAYRLPGRIKCPSFF
ncbi:MAG: DUF6089 family protein [Bacteroidia bacterium]|nr:DUF6089 family protein [Bacteroidia bacterium]